MEIQITLKTPEQLAKLIHFWHETHITPSFTKNDRYYSFLYQAIDAHILNPDTVSKETVLEDIEHLYEMFLKDYQSDPDEDTKEQLDSIINFLGIVLNSPDSMVLSNRLQIPTAHFKEFCGSEWLTPNGKISQRSVLLFFDQQCKIRKIRTEAGQIFLDDWARKLFQITATTIPRASLVDYIHSLLHS